MKKLVLIFMAIVGLSAMAADVLVKAQDTARKWTTDNALLEFIPTALRVRIQADQSTSGAFSISSMKPSIILLRDKCSSRSAFSFARRASAFLKRESYSAAFCSYLSLSAPVAA